VTTCSPQNREEFGEFFLGKKKQKEGIFARNFGAVSPFCDSSPKKKESKRLVSIVHPVFTPTEVRTPVPTICDKV
jgi:hypothetical protein